MIDFSAGGSQSVALAAIFSEAGCQRVLNRADACVVTRGTAANQSALWRTWCSFARVWGLQPIPLTVDGVGKILATFLAGQCRTPDQYVSEARRRHTFALGQPPRADVEITIKGYVRACKRGIGPSAAKDHFNFEELFPLPLFWTDTSKPGFPIAPVSS